MWPPKQPTIGNIAETISVNQKTLKFLEREDKPLFIILPLLQMQFSSLVQFVSFLF